MIKLLCALHVLMSVSLDAHAAPAVALADCEPLVAAVANLPNLSTVRIFLKKDLQRPLSRFRYSPEWIGSALRRSLREAHPVAPGRLRFVLFLSEPDDLRPVVRVEFDWFSSQNGIQIFHVAEFRARTDGALYRKIENETPLRNFPFKASLFDYALRLAFSLDFDLADVASAFEHPMGLPLENRVHEGQLWIIGRGAHDQLLSIDYLPADATGLVQIKAVTRVSAERKRAYFSKYGFTAEHDREPLEITRGPYRFKTVRFGPGLVAKVENQHGTTRAEVIEAFEESRGGVPSDALYHGSGERRWFVTKLRSGEHVKVTYVTAKDGGVTIVTAYHVGPPKLQCYKRLAAKFFH